MDKDAAALSKYLSFILRHQPQSIGLHLNDQGWAAVDELLACSEGAGRPIRHADLLEVVRTNDKQRFSLSEDGLRIRAAQGHSVPVDLALTPQVPPPVLYHGTATRFLDTILAEGLTPRSRQQVHLSADTETARKVGERHGKPVILVVDAAAMQEKGHAFYRADNGVWLTDGVPSQFLGVETGGV